MDKTTEQGTDSDRGDANSNNKQTDFVAIREAARTWIRGFNSVPNNIIAKLIESGDDIIEITPSADVERDSFLPMWSTMWSFDDIFDNSWIEDAKNLLAMAKCGFRVYEQEDYGYIFGIDGGGYDFYYTHWIPLYKARGLKWHL